MTLHLKGIDWEEQDVDYTDLKVDACVVQNFRAFDNLDNFLLPLHSHHGKELQHQV